MCGGGGSSSPSVVGSPRQDTTQRTVAKEKADGELKKGPKTRERLAETSKLILTEIRLNAISEGVRSFTQAEDKTADTQKFAIIGSNRALSEPRLESLLAECNASW